MTIAAGRMSRRIGTACSCAALLFLVVAARTPVVAAPPDTSPPASVATSAPVETSPDQTTPAETPPPESVPVTSNADVTDFDDDNQSVSIGWWIGGVVVAAAAAYGIAYSLRRRTTTEEWARHASVACDIGRATSLTLIAQLDEPVWSHPARYTEQHQRFSEHLTELHGSLPDQDFSELLDAVTAAAGRLHTAVEELPDGASIALARSTIEPVIDDLAITLDALEHEASITVFGATLPSSRTTG